MCIFKTLLFLPDFIFKLILHILADFLNIRKIIDPFSLFKNRHLKLLKTTSNEAAVLPVVHRIHITYRFEIPNLLSLNCKVIRNSLSILIIHTINFLDSGICNLFSSFRNLNPWYEFSILLYRNKLIHCTEYRC